MHDLRWPMCLHPFDILEYCLNDAKQKNIAGKYDLRWPMWPSVTFKVTPSLIKFTSL